MQLHTKRSQSISDKRSNIEIILFLKASKVGAIITRRGFSGNSDSGDSDHRVLPEQTPVLSVFVGAMFMGV